jgi:tetratricopeptide (TPR) repeat protein
VFWVDVSTPKQAEAGFLEIAKTLGSSIEEWHQVRQVLANTQEPWLLILDNADDASQDYKRYFPSASSGVIILTSRNVSCANLASSESSHISLEELSQDEATELLLRVARVPVEHRLATVEDARAIVRLLHGHALAIIQAGSYICSTYCPMSEYPKMFCKEKKKLLTFRPTQARARFEGVYATFEASIHALHAWKDPVAKDALELLPILAAFGPRGIPIALFQKAWAGARKLKLDLEVRGTGSGAATDTSTSEHIEILTEWHLSQLPKLLHVDAVEWDKEELVGALNLLESLAVITMDRTWDGAAISIHPLIHEWAKDRQKPVDRQRSWAQAACIIAITGSCEDRSLLFETQLRPHLRALMSTDMSEMFSAGPQLSVVQLLFKCLLLMRMMNDSVTLDQHLHQLFAHLQIDCETMDLRWLALYCQRASAFRTCGKIRKAIALYERVVAIQKETLSDEDPTLLDSQRGLALSYANDGQYHRAIGLFEHVIDVRGRHQAEDHPDQLMAKVGLARAYSSDGRHSDSITLLEHVVKVRAQHLKEDHPHRLGAQHWLARAYHGASRYEFAIRLMEYVVKMRCQVLSEDHPNRLGSQHWLAKSYQSTKQYKAAIALLEHVVKVRATALAEDHPSRLRSQHELAEAYSCDGQHGRAVDLLTHVVTVRARVLAADNLERLSSERELAKAQALRKDAEDPSKD